jgi:hypothetical protein
MMDIFRAFGNAKSDPVWNDVVSQSQNVMLEIQKKHSSETGLMPDFIVKDEDGFVPALPFFLEAETDGAYNYNAGRVPWRVGMDALLYDDQTSREIALKISHWVESAAEGDPANIRAGYELDGTPLPGSDYFSTFFVSPMGVAAMNDPAQQDWLNAIYESIYDQRVDYYEDSVTLLCLLVMTGNFWTP